jgi:hypothetical protein
MFPVSEIADLQLVEVGKMAIFSAWEHCRSSSYAMSLDSPLE